MFFYPSDIFHFRSFGCPLGSHPGSLRQKCDPDKCLQNSNKSRLSFLPIRHFSFLLLWLSLGIPSWILAAKVWSWQVFAKIKWISFMFFTHQTFSISAPSAVPWDPILGPCGKSVILTSIHKIPIKFVYVFLPIRHFPFPLLWLSLGIPSWILAAKVWSWQVLTQFK